MTDYGALTVSDNKGMDTSRKWETNIGIGV